MKSITLQFTDDDGKTIKSYTQSDIKTGLVDKAFQIIEMEKPEMKISDIREYYAEIRALIIDIYKNQFTLDELFGSVTQTELMKCYKAWISNILKN